MSMDTDFFIYKHMMEVKNQMQIGIWVVELKQNEQPRMYADSMMQHLLGVDENASPEDCYRTWHSRVFPTYIPVIESAIHNTAIGQKVEITYPWTNLSGHLTYVRCGAEIYQKDETIICLHGYHQDVTKLVVMEKEKQQADRFLQYVLNTLGSLYQGIHFINLTTKEVTLLRTFVKTITEKYNGRTIPLQDYKDVLSTYLSSEHVNEIYEVVDMAETFDTDVSLSFNYEECLDGKQTFLNFTMHIENVGNEKILIMAIRDISEQMKQEQNVYERIAYLKNKSETDELTGIKNRRSIENSINLYLKQMPKHQLSAFLLLDLDNFKKINDTFGHQKGDIVLQETAQHMKEISRQNDEIGRLGGDEFIIFLKNMKNIASIECYAQRMIDKLARTYTFGQSESVAVGTSIGIAVAPSQGIEFETLYHLADIALYQSKRDGKGRYTLSINQTKS